METTPLAREDEPAELIAPPERDSLGRVRRPAWDRERMLDAFERSGLAQAKFCRREGLDPTTFSGWVCKRRGQRERDLQGLKGPKGLAGGAASGPKDPSDAGTPVFREWRVASAAREVGAAAGAKSLTVVLPGGIEVRGCDAFTAAGLIRALREGR